MYKIYELAKPIQSDAIDTEVHREYPSASFISPSSLLVSDGQGTMYILELHVSSQGGNATLAGTFVFPSPGPESINSPFRIHHIHQPSPHHIVATLSSRFYSAHHSTSTSARHHAPVEFDVWGARINLLDTRDADTPTPLEILWRRRGEEVPMFATFIESLGLHLLLGGSGYRKLDMPSPPMYEPTSDEIAPIPREDGSSMLSNPPQRPPPYSWTQTSDSVTVAIPLPSTTPKEKIRVLFSPTTLTFHVDVDVDPNLQMPSEAFLPRYLARKLWDGISPTSSFWTFDRQAEHTYGILSLHLEKKNEGTRWCQVFAHARTGLAIEEDVDVPETLDPSELWNIREALEKFTSAFQGQDISGLGLGKGTPSLAENEIDEEVDSSVGRRAFVSWVYDSSQSGQVQPEFLSHQQRDTPFELLSTPIPGWSSDFTSLIVKSNIDGTVFELDVDSSLSGYQAPRWKHTATFSALAFVLASKRDTRFTHHVPGLGVFAFESGSNNQGGNVYIYYPADPKALTAKQSILKINDNYSGALMGVGAFIDSNGELIIACLTERKLTLIKGLY